MSTPNVYYDPGELGLEIVDTLDEPHLCYQYNTFLVVRHEASGRVFYAYDSGCSCPTPFEGYTFEGPDKTNMNEVTKHNFGCFEEELKTWCTDAEITLAEREALVDEVKRCFKA